MDTAYKLRHQHISFFKSVIRIMGYGMLWLISPAASFILVLSEVVGIAEEIGHE